MFVFFGLFLLFIFCGGSFMFILTHSMQFGWRPPFLVWLKGVIFVAACGLPFIPEDYVPTHASYSVFLAVLGGMTLLEWYRALAQRWNRRDGGAVLLVFRSGFQTLVFVSESDDSDEEKKKDEQDRYKTLKRIGKACLIAFFAIQIIISLTEMSLDDLIDLMMMAPIFLPPFISIVSIILVIRKSTWQVHAQGISVYGGRFIRWPEIVSYQWKSFTHAIEPFTKGWSLTIDCADRPVQFPVANRFKSQLNEQLQQFLGPDAERSEDDETKLEGNIAVSPGGPSVTYQWSADDVERVMTLKRSYRHKGPWKLLAIMGASMVVVVGTVTVVVWPIGLLFVVPGALLFPLLQWVFFKIQQKKMATLWEEAVRKSLPMDQSQQVAVTSSGIVYESKGAREIKWKNIRRVVLHNGCLVVADRIALMPIVDIVVIPNTITEGDFDRLLDAIRVMKPIEKVDSKPQDSWV